MKTVSFRETIISIRDKIIDPIYFLNGDDHYIQALFVEELMTSMSFDETVEKHFIAAESADYTSVVTDLYSDSLFGVKKLYVLHNPTRISGKAKDDLFRYCSTPNLNNCLILILDKVDRRLAFYKNLSKLVKPINTLPPFPNKMVGWIKFLIKRSGLETTHESEELLLELCGDSVYHIANEIEKMKIGLPENSIIKPSHIKTFCGWQKEFFPWHLTDAVGRRDLKDSILIVRSLLAQGVDTSLIISQLGTLFQELCLMSLPNEEEVVVKKIGWLNQIITRKLPIYFNNFSHYELETILSLLYDADRKMKTGKAKGEMLLIPLLYKIKAGYA